MLGAIVHTEPEWTTLPAGTPDRLRRMLQRCLAKDTKQRLHNIADARLEIEDLIAARRSGVAGVEPAAYDRPSAGLRPREIAAWALAALATTAVVAGAWLVVSGRWAGGAVAETPAMRLSILHNEGNEVGVAVISPDGRQLAFACQTKGMLDDLCVRDMQTGAVTKAIDSPKVWDHPIAWSSDGQYMLMKYDAYTGTSSEELRVWSVKARTLTPFITGPLNKEALFSPDAHFVAFTAGETGRAEVYVTTFPDREVDLSSPRLHQHARRFSASALGRPEAA